MLQMLMNVPKTAVKVTVTTRAPTQWVASSVAADPVTMSPQVMRKSVKVSTESSTDHRPSTQFVVCLFKFPPEYFTYLANLTGLRYSYTVEL